MFKALNLTKNFFYKIWQHQKNYFIFAPANKKHAKHTITYRENESV